MIPVGIAGDDAESEKRTRNEGRSRDDGNAAYEERKTKERMERGRDENTWGKKNRGFAGERCREERKLIKEQQLRWIKNGRKWPSHFLNWNENIPRFAGIRAEVPVFLYSKSN